VTQPSSPDLWDLDRIRQLVTQNELERGKIEYKCELGNGHKTLEAIAALANTFAGTVLVGVNETQTGTDRITGVDAGERDRLSRMCWDQLVPPFTPDIIPIKLDHGDKYVLAVTIDPYYARRPVMLTQGNKTLVRTEGHNVPADWYRLRDLFAEQPASTQDTGLPSADPSIYTRQGEYPDTNLAIRGRLLLTGPRGRPHHVTEPARKAVLAMLNGNDSTLTNNGALTQIMGQIFPGGWNVQKWQLDGRASTQQFNARWEGLQPDGRRLTEARLHVKLTSRPAYGDTLFIRLDALLTDPRRTREHDGGSWDIRQTDNPLAPTMAFRRSTDAEKPSALPRLPPGTPVGPFLDLGALRQLMLDTLGTLWGPPADTLSTGILGQPLGPPLTSTSPSSPPPSTGIWRSPRSTNTSTSAPLISSPGTPPAPGRTSDPSSQTAHSSAEPSRPKSSTTGSSG
jgi:hypothetical protein